MSKSFLGYSVSDKGENINLKKINLIKKSMNGYTHDLIKLLFGKGRKTENLRRAALLVLNELRGGKMIPAGELLAKVGHKKTFYKVIKSLKEVKLVAVSRDLKKKVYYKLEPKEFKGVFTNLAEKVVEELK
jgi:DNA-binding transcriptional ArsR family regulator